MINCIKEKQAMLQRILTFRQKKSNQPGWHILGGCLAFLFVPYIYMMVELYNFKGLRKFVRFICYHPKSALFGFLTTFLICAVVYLCCRRAWISATVCGTLFTICGLTNFIKVALNGDNFMPWDLTMVGNMGELLSFVSVRLPWWGYLIPLVTALYVVLLWYFRPNVPGRIWYRLVGALLLVGVGIGLFSSPKQSEKTLNAFGMDFSNGALQSSNYRANGFVGAFVLNLASMSVEPPEDYSAESVGQILQGYTATEGTEKPDVVVILCESFWDIRELPGTSFSKDPMTYFDRLCERKNCYSGKFYSTALGGGTVRSEFDVLTGLTTEYLPGGVSPYNYVSRDLSTYVSNYKDQGYKTLALHPYDKTFYMRNQAYDFVGFDEFYAQEEIEQMVDVSYRRGYVSDDSFADAIIKQLEENQDSPTFLWGISIENHQTYTPLESSEIEITVQNEALNTELLSAVTTYTQGVYHANQMLEKLVTYIDERDKDTILVFFGDHLPTLGANYAAYSATGLFDGENIDTAEAQTMYSTPFLVYGNYDLKSEVLSSKDNKISSYYLLDAVAEAGKTKRTAYMNLMLDEYQKVPFYNNRLHLKNSDEIKNLKYIHQMITYDRLIGRAYSD